MDTLYKILLSSTGDGLSLRVKSFLIGITPLVILILNSTGHSVIQSDVDILISQITNAVAAFGTIVSAGFFVFGWVRANVFKKNKLGKWR